MIDTGAGVIDADYRGIVFVLLFNLSDQDFTGLSCPSRFDQAHPCSHALAASKQSKKGTAWLNSFSSESLRQTSLKLR